MTFALIFASSVYAETCASVFRDTYQSFGELNRAEIEGVDFNIHVIYTGSGVSVIAPHGGQIEFGTSEIATAIAGRDLNLYLFNGCKRSDNFCLHVTSAHFDEPRAVDLMTRSDIGISIHGFSDKRRFVIVGGLNTAIARQVASSLRRAGFLVEFPATRFKGESPNNIVNLSVKKGVQIEISSALRAYLLRHPDRLNRFVRAIRATLPSYAYQGRTFRPS